MKAIANTHRFRDAIIPVAIHLAERQFVQISHEPNSGVYEPLIGFHEPIKGYSEPIPEIYEPIIASDEPIIA